jgi:uncharacterized protein
VFFNVRELEVRKVRFNADIPPGGLEFLDRHIRQVSPIHAEGVAELVSDTLGEIRIVGQYSVQMEAECDRCLEPIQAELRNDFDLIYLPTPKGQQLPPERAIEESETDIGFYEGNGIELGQILQEQVLLAMPMQQICNEQCRGICPNCGQNRNLDQCHCEQKVPDDRWAALKNLKTSSN